MIRQIDCQRIKVIEGEQNIGTEVIKESLPQNQKLIGAFNSSKKRD